MCLFIFSEGGTNSYTMWGDLPKYCINLISNGDNSARAEAALHLLKLVSETTFEILVPNLNAVVKILLQSMGGNHNFSRRLSAMGAFTHIIMKIDEVSLNYFLSQKDIVKTCCFGGMSKSTGMKSGATKKYSSLFSQAFFNS